MTLVSTALLVTLLLADSAVEASHRDVLLTRLGSAVHTGAYDFASGISEFDVRVFARMLDRVQAGAASGNDPGFNAIEDPAIPHQALPGEVEVVLEPHASRSVVFWDGEGPLSFGRPPPDVAVRVSLGGALGTNPVLWLDDDGPPGVPIATTDAGGGLHQHLVFSVVGQVSDADDGPPPGAYLLSLRVAVQGLDPSAPLFLLLGHDVDPRRVQQAAQCLEPAVRSDVDFLNGELVACPALESTPDEAETQMGPTEPASMGCAVAPGSERHLPAMLLVLGLLLTLHRRRHRGELDLSGDST